MKILIFFLCCCLLSSPVLARGYTATYDVYAGGIHALQAKIDYNETGKKYGITVSSKTYGILDKIVPWHAVFKTDGNLARDKRLPSEHISDTTTRRKHEVNTYHYDKNGAFRDFRQVVDGKDETRKDLDPSISAGTIDVLTALFTLTDAIEKGGDCARESMLFDSERSYRLIFRNGPQETIKPGKYSSFSGAAKGCAFEIKPEGGKWHKKPRGWMKIQQQAKKSGIPPVIFFADVSNTDEPLFVPVRTVIKTDLGTFIAHMTSFEEKTDR